MFPEGPEGAGSHTLCSGPAAHWGGRLVRAPCSQRPMCMLLHSPPARFPWRSAASLCLLMASVSVCAGLAGPAGCFSRGPSGARGLTRPPFLLST